MRYLIWSILVVCLVTSACFAVVAQESSTNPQLQDYASQPLPKQTFDEQRWQESTSGLKYELKRDKPKVKKPRKSAGFNWPELGKGWVLLLRGLLVALLIVLLALLIRHYLLAPRNTAVRPVALEPLSIEELEDHLEDTELAPYIRQAIAQQDYPLAVRLYYLEMLKQLAAKTLINWRKNKTNRQYLHEMRPSEHYRAFRELTLVFERVRYGGQSLTQQEFAQLEPAFQSFLGALAHTVPVSPSANAAV